MKEIEKNKNTKTMIESEIRGPSVVLLALQLKADYSTREGT